MTLPSRFQAMQERCKVSPGRGGDDGDVFVCLAAMDVMWGFAEGIRSLAKIHQDDVLLCSANEVLDKVEAMGDDKS